MGTIRFYFEGIKQFKLHSRKMRRFLVDLISNEQKKAGEINIVFCSDPYLLSMNKKYLKHDYFTDIITFDYSDKEIISGEMFISKERIADNAKIYNTGFMNELNRVIIHGVLHLTGYKDKLPAEKELMKEKEDFYLNKYLLNY